MFIEENMDQKNIYGWLIFTKWFSFFICLLGRESANFLIADYSNKKKMKRIIKFYWKNFIIIIQFFLFYLGRF